MLAIPPTNDAGHYHPPTTPANDARYTAHQRRPQRCSLHRLPTTPTNDQRCLPLTRTSLRTSVSIQASQRFLACDALHHGLALRWLHRVQAGFHPCIGRLLSHLGGTADHLDFGRQRARYVAVPSPHVLWRTVSIASCAGVCTRLLGCMSLSDCSITQPYLSHACGIAYALSLRLPLICNHFAPVQCSPQVPCCKCVVAGATFAGATLQVSRCKCLLDSSMSQIVTLQVPLWKCLFGGSDGAPAPPAAANCHVASGVGWCAWVCHVSTQLIEAATSRKLTVCSVLASLPLASRWKG
jgi:hypothetical protein